MKQILDACCGSKMFHFDKENPLVLFQDIRPPGDYSVYSKKVILDPDVVGDFRNMDFPDESFYLVVFDPPHLLWAGKRGRLKAAYGDLNKDTWQDDIRRGFDECWRVLKPGGTLIFKWSEAQIKLSEVLKLAPAEPIFGNKGRGTSASKTHWLVFYKEISPEHCLVTRQSSESTAVGGNQ